MIHKIPTAQIRARSKQLGNGYYDELMSSGTIGMEEVLLVEDKVYRKLVAKYNSKPTPRGPGTELKKLLSKLGLKPAPNCQCNARILLMNGRGVDWCAANIDIIVGWLREEATRAKLPFVEVGARLIVKRAIRNARKRA
jgi:hypothetical protein